MLAGTGRLTRCYLIFVKLAVFEVNAAVLSYAKGSTMNWFGGDGKKSRGFI